MLIMEYYINKECLYFTNNYNKPLSQNILDVMKKVKKIKFSQYFNYPIDNLPQNIEEIDFSSQVSFLCNGFNHPIDNLPMSLHTLILSNSFNQSVNYLPCSLKKIVFGDYFNQDVDNLPSSIEILEFGWVFKKSIKNLPASLKVLKLHINYFGRDYYSRNHFIPDFIFKKGHQLNKFEKFDITKEYDFIPKYIEKFGIRGHNKTIMFTINKN